MSSLSWTDAAGLASRANSVRVKETTGPEKQVGIQAPQNGTAMRMLRLAARSTVPALEHINRASGFRIALGTRSGQSAGRMDPGLAGPKRGEASSVAQHRISVDKTYPYSLRITSSAGVWADR
jgi:hypothetical protein